MFEILECNKSDGIQETIVYAEQSQLFNLLKEFNFFRSALVIQIDSKRQTLVASTLLS